MSSSSSFMEQREDGKEGDDPEIISVAGVLTPQEEDELRGSDQNTSILDRISELPDEIVVKILSRLTLKESARTSILSNRWKDLWKSSVTVLDFEALEMSEDSSNHNDCISVEKMRRYVDWVSGVLRQLHHASSKVSKFRVSFDLDRRSNSNGDIDRWLEFAVSKGIESLELSLYLNSGRKRRGKFYRFSQSCFQYIQTPAGLSKIRSLRCLRLSYVDVKGVELQHFISNCPLLEELRVVESDFLLKLNVVGSSSSSPPLPLKHLEVTACSRLESLHIDHAPHLTHLAYQGQKEVELCVTNCPALVHVSFALDVAGNIIASPVLGSLSACTAARLESLTLTLRYIGYERFQNVPEFTNLKLLTIQSSVPTSCPTLFGWIPVINACPRLHRLRMELCTFHFNAYSKLFKRYRHVTQVGRESIKVVEIVGFTGYHMECEFIEYVLEYFVGLERMVVDRGIAFRRRTLLQQEADDAKTVALEFKWRLPTSFEYVVI